MKLLANKALDCLLALLMLFAAMSAEADTYVNGYFKKDGTYVEGHFKTTPHDTILIGGLTQLMEIAIPIQVATDRGLEITHLMHPTMVLVKQSTQGLKGGSTT